MKVKIFDQSHELDLEEQVNNFLANLESSQVIDIKYQVSIMYDYKNQIYCYSAMIIYHE